MHDRLDRSLARLYPPKRDRSGCRARDDMNLSVICVLDAAAPHLDRIILRHDPITAYHFTLLRRSCRVGSTQISPFSFRTILASYRVEMIAFASSRSTLRTSSMSCRRNFPAPRRNFARPGLSARKRRVLLTFLTA